MAEKVFFVARLNIYFFVKKLIVIFNANNLLKFYLKLIL
jgi:hypothetical protein